jgi:prephenate dehydratase
MLKIAYLGPGGSHSHAAVQAFVDLCLQTEASAVSLIPMSTMTHILDAVDEGALDLAAIPVENALEGSVAEILDSLTLVCHNTHVIAEFVRPIRHALIRRYEFLEGISCVHSHPQAIGQCRDAVYSLLGKDIKFVPASSTSEAVKSLLTMDETHAALGSVQAAQHYGLEILVENIGDLQQNATRFWMLSASQANQALLKKPLTMTLKTSLCLGLEENRPGGLLCILGILAEHQLNMSKIESRPTKRILGEYLFYLDIEGEIPAEVEAAIRNNTSVFKCLGIYPTFGTLEV